MDIMPGVSALCGKIAIAEYALPGSEKLGGYISSKFAAGMRRAPMAALPTPAAPMAVPPRPDSSVPRPAARPVPSRAARALAATQAVRAAVLAAA